MKPKTMKKAKSKNCKLGKLMGIYLHRGCGISLNFRDNNFEHCTDVHAGLCHMLSLVMYAVHGRIAKKLTIANIGAAVLGLSIAMFFNEKYKILEVKI